jgi:hypothetical protein
MMAFFIGVHAHTSNNNNNHHYCYYSLSLSGRKLLTHSTERSQSEKIIEFSNSESRVLNHETCLARVRSVFRTFSNDHVIYHSHSPSFSTAPGHINDPLSSQSKQLVSEHPRQSHINHPESEDFASYLLDLAQHNLW